MSTLRSVLEIPGHAVLGDEELRLLHSQFANERLSADDGYNAIAKEIGQTFSETKSSLPEFRFVVKLETAICILFDESPQGYGCYIISKDDKTCAVVDSRFRERVGLALNAEVKQLVTTYPEWERPKMLWRLVLERLWAVLAVLLTYLVGVTAPSPYVAGLLALITVVGIAGVSYLTSRR